MERYGHVRVAAAIPPVHIADPASNETEALALLKQAERDDVDLVVFPELSITGYTCGDLFQQRTLLESARRHLMSLIQRSADIFSGIAIVGVPILKQNQLYNTAALFQGGNLLALAPKRFIPNYKEFYERRWFGPPRGNFESLSELVEEQPTRWICENVLSVPEVPGLAIGVEICEDLWVPIPPSSRLALLGATVLVNLSASNESTGKAEYRRQLVLNQSGRCVAAYIYCAAGVTESTTDLVFGGHAMIAENGVMLAESKRFQRGAQLLVADVDVERLAGDRARLGTFTEGREGSYLSDFADLTASLPKERPWTRLRRHVPAHPFVPTDPASLADRCYEIFETQMAGLAKRIESAHPPKLVLGVSGGLDSTLALLVAAKTCDLLGRDRKMIDGVTLPGFGTSQRTRHNAEKLMKLLGVQAETIDIRRLCLDAFVALGHRPFGIDPVGKSLEAFTHELEQVPAEKRHDLVFENVQARIRTFLLMSRGFVVGTGDLSELALGWCTYNGDHMSMYNPNVSIPKTLVKFLVRWVAENEFDGPARDVLLSIVETEISPELLPVGPEHQMQSTEGTIGPYELHDFFLYHMLRFGFSPRKIAYLASQAAFERRYSPDEIRHWLEVFYRRFFQSQFKRSCLPDGPKVGSVSLSPRGDWRMPSDAQASRWLEDIQIT